LFVFRWVVARAASEQSEHENRDRVQGFGEGGIRRSNPFPGRPLEDF
jgi:hypothetical protein